jgi:hypothetical protein
MSIKKSKWLYFLILLIQYFDWKYSVISIIILVSAVEVVVTTIGVPKTIGVKTRIIAVVIKITVPFAVDLDSRIKWDKTRILEILNGTRTSNKIISSHNNQQRSNSNSRSHNQLLKLHPINFHNFW